MNVSGSPTIRKTYFRYIKEALNIYERAFSEEVLELNKIKSAKASISRIHKSIQALEELDPLATKESVFSVEEGVLQARYDAMISRFVK